MSESGRHLYCGCFRIDLVSQLPVGAGRKIVAGLLWWTNQRAGGGFGSRAGTELELRMLVVDVVNVLEGEVVVCVVCVNVGDDGGRIRGVEDWESRYLYASSAGGRVSLGRPVKSVAPPVVLSSKIRVGSKDYVGGIHLQGRPGMAPCVQRPLHARVILVAQASDRQTDTCHL